MEMLRQRIWKFRIFMWFTVTSLVCITIVSVSVSALTAVIAAPVIVDTSLTPVSTFSVNITVTNVEKMWGYQFRLYYNTTILTATDYGSYSPFTVEHPSEINDTAGLASVSYSMQMGEKVGFSTVDPAPMAWIGFTVDAYGISSLDLRKSQLVTVDAEAIPHDVSDGYFGNDGLLSKYNDLLADYVTLNTTYHSLLTEYNDLLTRYDQLNSTYSSLLANPTQLQTNYHSLQSEYDSLSADFSNLETDYNTLQANYNSIETAYDSLNSIYNSLKADYDNLESKHEVSTNELSTARNLNYLLVVTTIVFIATTAYLVIRKPKVKPT